MHLENSIITGIKIAWRCTANETVGFELVEDFYRDYGYYSLEECKEIISIVENGDLNK